MKDAHHNIERVQVDPLQIERFLKFFADGAVGSISLRVFKADTCSYIRTVSAEADDLVEQAVEVALIAEEMGGVFCPPPAVFLGRQAREVDLAEARLIVVDLDADVAEARAKIEAVLGRPSMVVASGGVTEAGEQKVHLYWRLKRPAATSEEFGLLKACRKAAAEIAGSDRSAVTIVHPMRWPGSLHLKNGGRRLCSVVEDGGPDLALQEAVSRLEAALGRPVTAESMVKDAKPKEELLAPSWDALRGVVRHIPNSDRPWDEWNKVGMALFNASGGSDEGLEMWLEWSSRSSKHDAGAAEGRWAHWGRGHAADYLGWHSMMAMRVKTEEDYERIRERLGVRREKREAAAAAVAEAGVAEAEVAEAEVAEAPGGFFDFSKSRRRHYMELRCDYTAERIEEMAVEFGGMDELLQAPAETIKEVSDFLDAQAQCAAAEDVFRAGRCSPLPPRGVLPQEIEELAFGLQNDQGADPGLVAIAILVASSGLMHGDTRIKAQLREGGKPLVTMSNLYGLGIAPPGSRKSMGADIGNGMFDAVAADFLTEYAKRLEDTREQLAEEGQFKGEKLEKEALRVTPCAPVFAVGNATPEGIRNQLAEEGQERRPIAMYLDEFAALLKQLKGYSANSTLQQDLLTGYDGGKPAGSALRVGAGNIRVENYTLAVYGTTQPAVIEKALVEETLIESGLIQRFLPIIGRKWPKGGDVTRAVSLEVLEMRLQAAAVLMARYPAQQFVLSEAAARSYRAVEGELSNRAEALNSGGGFDLLAEAMSKGATTIVKLALILHRLEHALSVARNGSAADKILGRHKGRGTFLGAAPSETVTVETFDRAVRLYKAWLLESIAVFVGSNAVQKSVAAAASWILEKDAEGVNEFSRRDLQKGCRALKDGVYKALPIYASLEDAGWLIPEEVDAQGFASKWRTPRGIAERFEGQLRAYREQVAWVREAGSQGG